MKISRIIPIVFFASLMIFLLIQVSCKKESDEDSTNPTAPVYTNGQGEIGPLGGTLTITDENSNLFGVSISIPEGALASSEYFKLEEAHDSIKFPGDLSALVLKLSPEGIEFINPVEISFPINGSYNNTKLRGYYLDPFTNHVEQIPTFIDETTNKAIITTVHFSYFCISDGFWANVTMYYINNKPSVKFWIDGEANGSYGFDGIPTTFYLTLQGLYSAKKVVDEGVFLLDDGVMSYFKVKLKKKVAIYWFDPTIEEKKVFVRRVGDIGSFGAEIIEGELINNNITYSDIDMTSDEREPFFHGPAIIVNFDTQLENDKEYYVVADWRLIDAYPIIWGLTFPYTSNYEVNNYDYALTPPDMDHQDDDLDDNAVDDYYESTSQNTPPVAFFTIDPTAGNTSTVFSFDASGCHDNEDPTSDLEVRWDWENDGTWDVPYSTNKIIAHQYTQSGNYTIKLEVKDTEGLTDTETSQIVVNPVGGELPTVITYQASNITQNSANSGGNVTDEGSSSVISRGLCWNTSGNPTIANFHTSDGSGSGTFISNISGLSENTLYYIRAYATNNEGVGYGEEKNFTTSSGGNAPSADFSANITSGPAPLSVTFTDQSTNNPTNWQWEFGDGETSTQANPTHTYNNNGTYTVSLTATNEYGSDTKIKTSYIVVIEAGNPLEADFTSNITIGPAPLTISFTDLSINNPTIWEWDFGDGGTSNDQNSMHTYNDEGCYTVTLTVSNSYSDDTEVKSNFILVYSGGSTGEPCPGIPTIYYQGQTYNTVLIGSMCWMKENLNYETGNSWCYNNNTSNCNTYGRLYDFETIMNGEASSNSVPSGVQGICPNGWHLPSDEEWKILEGTVDSQYGVGHSEWDDLEWRGFDAGKNLKTTSGWDNNGNGTDEYGFSALPGGYRTSGSYAYFIYLGSRANFWSTTVGPQGGAWCRRLYYNVDEVNRSNASKQYGYSVRCLKD